MMRFSERQQNGVASSALRMPVPDVEGGRRSFIRALGLGAIGTAIVASTGIGPAAAQSAPSDTDVLNFALNFEYLGAEFYLRASVGRGLSDGEISGTGRLGPVAGGRQIGFDTNYIRNFANECQTALNIDPGSASNFDPLDAYDGTPLVSPAKRVGVAQPG